MFRRRSCYFWLILFSLGAREVYAATDEIRLIVLLRALAYDEALAARAGPRIVVALLTPGTGSDTALFASLQAVAKVTVRGLPIAVVELTYSGADALASELEQKQISAVYLAAGLDAEVPAIVAITRAHKVRTLSSSEAYLRLGASLAALDTAGSDKPRLAVNIAASKQEGMALSAQLLQVAKHIEP